VLKFKNKFCSLRVKSVGSVERRTVVIQLTDLILQLEDVQKEAAGRAQQLEKSHSLDCIQVSLLLR
jgi:hypothetical protein